MDNASFPLSGYGEDDEANSSLLKDRTLFQPSSRSLWSRYRGLIIAHIVLFIIYASVLIRISKMHTRSPRDAGLPFSPATEALEFEERTFNFEDRVEEKGIFSGIPSPALDQAWHDLLDHQNIKLEPEVVSHFGREHNSVALPEGGGFIGTLNVFHELHCLKRLYQYIYRDHYFQDLDAFQVRMNKRHAAHCIDYLRQAAMCHGDVGVITFEWWQESRIPVANVTTHQCINWEKLEAWTRARSVDMMKPGWLVHPTQGVAYTIDEGEAIHGGS